MPADKKTQDLVDEISGRIQDLCQGNEDDVASALGLVLLKVLNSKYRPDFSEHDIDLIRSNYPNATDLDIQERGLAEAGVVSLISIFQMASKIAIDYSPLTNVQEYVDADNSGEKRIKAQEIAAEAYAEMRKIGLSSYGSASTMMFLGTASAQAEGVSFFKIARSMIEALRGIFENSARNAKFSEEAAITAISQQLGISRKEAMKYVANYKQLKTTGKL